MNYQFFFVLLLFFIKIYNSPVAVTDGGTGLITIPAHNLLIGNDTEPATVLAPSATTGIPIVSQGSSADPAFSTAVVEGGGTGLTSATAYAVLCGGTTSTNPFQSLASVGNVGQVLTSAGAGGLPTWTNPFIFQTATAILTAAQVNSLRASPVTLVAAAGAGTVICVLSCVAKMTYGGSNVFATSTGSLSLRYGTASGSIALTTAFANAGIIAASDQIASTIPFGFITSYGSATNSPVIVTNSVATEFTGGAGNTISITITYKVLTLP